MTEVSKRFGAGLTRRMARERLTHAEVAERMGVARVTFTAYASGRISPTVDRLVAIADALGCSPSVLVKGLDLKRTTKLDRRRIAAKMDQRRNAARRKEQ